jgi:hypothetical protein
MKDVPLSKAKLRCSSPSSLHPKIFRVQGSTLTGSTPAGKTSCSGARKNLVRSVEGTASVRVVHRCVFIWLIYLLVLASLWRPLHPEVPQHEEIS